jgi:hypothetical protein
MITGRSNLTAHILLASSSAIYGILLIFYLYMNDIKGMKGLNCLTDMVFVHKQRLLLGITCMSLLLAVSDATLDYSCVHETAWIINSEHTNSYFSSVLTDVTASAISGTEWSVTTNRIPNYDHAFTASEISALNSRPRASSDFTTGATTVAVGETVIYGANIGYVGLLHGQGCDMKYWPPGPGCPTAVSSRRTIDLTPSPETRSAGYRTPEMNHYYVFERCYVCRVLLSDGRSRWTFREWLVCVWLE